MLRLEILLLLATTVFGDFSGCPMLPTSRTCQCGMKTRGLDLSCDSASREDLLQSVRAVQDSRLWYLKIRNVRLSVLGGELLAGGGGVSHLIALNCSIASVEDDAFVQVAEHLESLDLGNNRLERVPTSALQPLVRLSSLNLNYNRIESLHASAFRGLVSLLRLSLFGNRIHSVHLLAFEGIGGNLTHLNLGGNSLGEVPAAPLRNLTGLQRLQVQENQISALVAVGDDNDDDEDEEWSSGGGGAGVDVLELSGNLLEEVPERAFAHLRALNSLDLDNNRIQRIHEKAFIGVEGSLEWLKLGDNQLESIPSSPLSRLRRLRQLDLRHNRIERVREEDFRGYGGTIKFIYLQKNRLHTIESGALSPLNSLEWLYLQSNELRTANHDTFRAVLDTLNILDMHENPFDCDCRISWLRDLVKEHKSKVNMPKDTRCHSPLSLRGKAIPQVTSVELGCAVGGATSASAPASFLFIFSLILLVILR